MKNAEVIKQPETKGGVMTVTPSPFLGQRAKIRGENFSIKIAENLEASVFQQELPNIWLEFEQGNGEVSRIELDSKFNENLKSAGEHLYRYQFVINNSENPDDRAQASYNQLMSSVNARNEIRKLEADLPDGKRKLTEDEIEGIFRKQSGLINDRYFELDDHFKPKSSFYKLKKSISKKLGYSIF
ncbi:MAG TPA: hypothetical protein VNB22_20425 [Pyrinomonadaceae bacterium]|nr:hypothetical protein [Pyrinomonadaceae bacterium]